MIMKRLILTPMLAAVLFACTTEAEEDKIDVGNFADEFNYTDIEFPEHFSVDSTSGRHLESVLETDNTPEDNPITDAGANLGRYLFYDVNLSANNTISCSSCHQAEFGFSDPRVLSLGFEDGETGRHSMGLTNARFYDSGMFFWDQRAETLEDQVLMPFQDEVEMGMTLGTLVQAVEEQEHYPFMFETVFGDSEVTSERISLVLAQFVRSMVSFGSKYDEGRAQVNDSWTDFPNFTEEENLGKEIFMQTPNTQNGVGCAVCHEGEAMIGWDANNNGLDSETSGDQGYGEITGLDQDQGTFKFPSLRNIAVRGTFMHDGRFSSLREVVDHYTDSVESHANLGVPLSMHNFNLSESKREAVVAFLKTLTDSDMLTDPKFADPYNK
jgi:cytochrome c peroxidase